jgi:hypothetical protein
MVSELRYLLESTTMLTSAAARPRRALAVICVLAFAVRVVAMVALETWEFSPANQHWAAGWETGRIADHLARGLGFSLGAVGPEGDPLPTAWLAPLYPALVGKVFTYLGSFTVPALIVVLLLQSLFDAATTWVIGRLGMALGCARGGLIGASLFAFSPAAINISTRILWNTPLLGLLCVLLLLRLVGHARGETRPLSLVVTGLVIGTVLLTSPVPAAFIGAAGAWLTCRQRGVRCVAVMATVATLTIAPWMIRNVLAFDAFFFIKSNAGNELFIGNNPLATGGYVRVGGVAREVLGAAEYERLTSLDEVGRARFLGNWSMRWIVDHPTEFLALTARRVWIFWSAPFLTDWELLPLGPLTSLAPRVYNTGRVLLLALAALGGWRWLRRSREGWLVVLFLLCFPIAYCLTHADTTRYRSPVVGVLTLLAGSAVTSRKP